MNKKKEICSNTVNVLYNAIVTYVDLTLKIHSTFINETIKVLQIQLS